MMHSVCTGNQVSSLIWGQRHQELYSGHGFTDNEVVVWSYPKMESIYTLSYHQDRILSMDLSPDGNNLVSIGADECLCLWKIDTAPPRRRTAVAASPSFGSRFTIR
jgi:cell division cycle protein 20 (cofactor of APC complex)